MLPHYQIRSDEERRNTNPATGSPTATLLRLHPSRWRIKPLVAAPIRTRFPYWAEKEPHASATSLGTRDMSDRCFGLHPQIPGCDGRCVKGQGTDSPRQFCSAITSDSTFMFPVAVNNPNPGSQRSAIQDSLRLFCLCIPLYWPIVARVWPSPLNRPCGLDISPTSSRSLTGS